MIKVFADTSELNNFAAEEFARIAADSIAQRGRFAVALAGGSTPKSLYELLASDEFKDEIDWSRVVFFFGDERAVLPDDTESNFKMANENLFAPLKIKDENIFRWQTELKDAEKIAADYERKIKEFFGGRNQPADAKNAPADAENGELIAGEIFDLILLGMGADGHTASLFPFTDALRETAKNAVPNYVEKLETMRYTLTFPIINRARNVIFLVKGADKAETLRAVLEGEFQPEKLPSQMVKPAGGNLFWLCAADAAALLSGEIR